MKQDISAQVDVLLHVPFATEEGCFSADTTCLTEQVDHALHSQNPFLDAIFRQCKATTVNGIYRTGSDVTLLHHFG